MTKKYVTPEIKELKFSVENVLSTSVNVVDEGVGLSASWNDI